MFVINGILWNICFVNPDDLILYDYVNNIQSVATTDWNTKTIYISNNVSNAFLLKILKHELYHCYEFSKVAYDTPRFYEEHIADFIATHGEDLINLAYLIWYDLQPT